ncbi:MAG: DUF6159 family protein [Anaerolineales bacterium]
MDSLRRGLDFLMQSWSMVSKDHDLIKPSIYALFAGIIVTLIGSIPLVITMVFFGGNGLGKIIGYLLGGVLIFLQYMVSYLFSAMTVYLVFGYISSGDGNLSKAWEIVKRDWLDILSLATASTFVNLLRGLVRGRGKSPLANSFSSLINTLWTEATYLVLPAMVIDDLNLKMGLKRATQIVKENLLLVGVSTVGVKAVTGIIGFLLGGSGVMLGIGIGVGLIGVSGQTPWGLISGISAGVIVAAIFIMISVIISSYTLTAYHTCLYIWARDVEKNQLTESKGVLVQPPAPLAAVLK